MFKLELSYYQIFKRIAIFIVIVVSLKIIIFHLTPFFLAAVVALILEKPVVLLSKKMPRLLAVLIVLSIFILIMITLAIILSSNLISELIELGRLLPRYREQIISGIEELIQRQEDFFEVIPDEIANIISQNINMIYQRGNILLSQMVNRILNLTFNIPWIFIFIIFTILGSFYMSKDRNKLLSYFSQKIDLTDKEKIKLLKDFSTYIKVQLIIITNTTIWVGVTLSLIDFPYAIILALAAGILDLIPVVGPGGILWPLIALHLFINPSYSFILFVVYVLVVGFRPFLEAKILGTNIGVHPLVLLLGLFVGLNLLGFQGIILAPLSIIVFKVLLIAELV